MIKYEVMASTGKYTNKNGEEKNRWVKCGVIMTTKNGGFALKLETIPVGSDGWFSLFEPKAKDDQPVQQSQNLSAMQDDVPW